MAKVSLTKLGLKVNQDIKTIEFNEQVIEVKQYLSINEKLELISNVINQSAEDKNYANPVQVEVLTKLELMYAYTNINFTEKQKEDVAKLYDQLYSSGLLQAVINALPTEEYYAIINGVKKSIEAIYTYKNSLLGIFETITTDYSQMNLDANEIYSKLADPDNMALLKNVLTKLG